MVASKFLLKLTDDKKFVEMVREIAINFVVACEVKLEIEHYNSAIYTRRGKKPKAVSNFDS